MWFPTRRQFLAWGGAAASTGLLHSVAYGQAPGLRPMRIGVTVPSQTGNLAMRASINDYVGEGGRKGAIYAESQIGELASGRGWYLKVLHASTPSPDAARRAGERMVETGDICALVGGIGEGQAEVLSEIAEKARIPFFNVGSSRDALRHAGCGRYTFHIEASEAMYLDVLVKWYASRGLVRWSVVYENSEHGRALHARSLRAISRHGLGGEAVGSVSVFDGQPDYRREIDAIRSSSPDVILLLANEIDQISIMGQLESAGFDVPAVTFPTGISQTRDYLSAVRKYLPATNPRNRVALWETTLQANGGDVFNENFLMRFGQPTDPTAWAVYHAIKILFESIDTIGTLNGSELVAHLENPSTVFEVSKGTGVSFRAWDHQLRQPLYVIEVDQELVWVRANVSTHVGLARPAAMIPDVDPVGDALARLDQFGDGPEDSLCRP